MDQGASTRFHLRVILVVTLLLVPLELALLVYIHGLDDAVDRQQAAYQRAAGSLASVELRASPEVASATGRAVQSLLDSGIDEESALAVADRFNAWVTAPKDADALDALRAEVSAVGRSVEDRRSRTELLTLGLQAALLLAVTLGWFAWTRRLDRSHSAVSEALTERLDVDAYEQRLRALAEHSADVILVLEHDSTVVFASPSTSDVLGQLPERLVGRRLLELVSATEASALARHLVTRRTGEQTLTVRMSSEEGRGRVLDGTLNNLTHVPWVNGWVLTLRDVTDRHMLEDRATDSALHDELTGLANRHLFRDRLGHALARGEGGPEELAVLVCDIDDFKHVNDSRGHAVGDHLLVEVGQRLRSLVGPGDTVARLEGDDFALLLERGGLGRAEQVAEQLQDLMREPFRCDGTAVALAVSIGIAPGASGVAAANGAGLHQADTHACRGEQVLRNADVAMCWAKDRGRGTFAVYEAGLHSLALERMALRSELQQAIRERQFVLHYQPTVDLMTEAITGFEALVRWQHPSRGLLGPQAFIPIAEQSGLITELGTWVLGEACLAAAGLQSLTQHPTMSVNVAAQQVVAADFVDVVVGALQAAALRPESLVLEITESVLLEDMAGAVDRLAELRELGVHVAIDDFGTGYSSLSYLSRLPVDILKVDKSFVDSVCADVQGASVTSAILSMSQTMQLVTVAEGVELPEQAAWLKRADCMMGQGYLWSRPVELDLAHHLLRSGVPRQRGRTEDRHARPLHRGDQTG